MCGIAGIFSRSGQKPSSDVLKAMTNALRHRGPDFQGVLEFDDISFGHARLSVIDLSAAANQPLSDISGRFLITCNGEIYNFPELRKELEASGAIFRTNGDIEVAVEAFKTWGTDCFAKFNGMFALAIWDKQEKVLTLARDKLGKKPLFWSEAPSGDFIFTSELRALLPHPDISREINEAAVADFLTFGSVGSHHSILKSVHKIPAASFMQVSGDKVSKPAQYWNLASFFHTKSKYNSMDDACDELQSLMQTSIKRRLIADVPIGAFLSGGVDSGIIVAEMAGLRGASSVRTFSAGFREKSYNEVDQARIAATVLGVTHNDAITEPPNGSEFEDILWCGDEPFADNSLIPMYYLSKLARQDVTVCLSGDGGDELFAGYETYKADLLRRRLGFVPGALATAAAKTVDAVVPPSKSKVSLDFKLRQFLGGLSHNPEMAHLSWRRYFSNNALRTLMPDADALPDDAALFEPGLRFFNDVSHCDPIDAVTYVDIKTWMHDDILVKGDRASMAHSLELRAPFLDPDVVQFAARLPVSYKIKNAQTKKILKSLYSRHLPPGEGSRKKLGFNAPIAHWFSDRLKDSAFAATTNAAMNEWAAQDIVTDLWRDHWSGRRDNSFRLYALAALGTWLTKMQNIKQVKS